MTEIKNSNNKAMRIEAEPTKDLFITMLTKDITLRDAIGDLIDNSVDAARKSIVNKSDLSAFEINIIANEQSFSIRDNCGGLDSKTARESAFCFGKPRDYQAGNHTIGQFGIGMKRAFFKIGQKVEMNSKSLISTFKMHINVAEWKETPGWDFSFDDLSENQNNAIEDTFTEVNITELNPDVKSKFSDEQTIIDLINEISLEHLYSINQGLKIKINNTPLKARNITLTYDKDRSIEPAFWSHDFKNGLSVEILAGISEDVGQDGGWYIFCNDRLVLGPDTTEKTGWSGAGNKEMPKYHDQYFRFRGYVFFNADDSAKLPWTTTKTGMNMDAPAWLFTRGQMIIIAKQVKKVMDDMKKERERGNPESERLLSNTVQEAKIVPVATILSHKSQLPIVYKYPENLINVAPKSKKKGLVKVTFYKSDSVIQEVKQHFDVDDANSAGEMAFDHFYENEI